MNQTKGVSAIERFRQKVQQQPTVNTQRSSSNDKLKQQPDSLKGQIRSNSPRKQIGIKPSHSNLSCQNISKKQAYPTNSLNRKDNITFKPKGKLSNLICAPMNTLEGSKKEPDNKERELKNQFEISVISEDCTTFPSEEQQQKLDQVSSKINNVINETLQKMERKLASAKRKIELGSQRPCIVNKFQKATHVTSFEPQMTDVQVSKNQRKELNISTDNTNRLESTAPLSEKQSLNPMETPYQATSNFNLGEQAKTPCQFMSDISVKTSNTDEFGNRHSIMPSAQRPSLASEKKSSAKKKIKNEPVQKEENEIEQTQDDPKNLLEQMKQENQIRQESKSIRKTQKERTNFVRLNMKKNYKPSARGAVFTNKIMAKKKNQLKFRENYKRKLQIEAAKNRDQVNIYGGLGKVGLDHEGTNYVDNEGEEIVPTFSSSAMKLIQKPVKDSDGSESEEEKEIAEFEPKEVSATVNIEEELKNIAQDEPLYEVPKSDQEFRDILKKQFGFDDFLEGQLEAIKILLQKKENALVVLATGGGKSLIYQYTSLFLTGLVIVVTPLIALMTDQLRKLPSFIMGGCINAQQQYALKKQVYQAIQDKHLKVLFISPERFFVEDFSKFNRKIAMVCIDEIHCASEWSHNFRPTYLKLNDMIKSKIQKDAVVVGLTATATKATQHQICKIFDIKSPQNIVTQPDLSRLNLLLSITRDAEKQKSLLQLLRSDSFRKLTSILIYATQQRTCDQLASFLTQNGFNSASYHASKTDQQRQAIQKQFINNQIKVLVCTIAFSMGIDKSDIQSVIHYDMPRSVEGYVQEIGRAGRDGKLARCHLFLNDDDFYQIRRITLTNLLDSQSALKLTSNIICEAKRELLKIVDPTLKASKKRKFKSMSGEEKAQVIDEFENEAALKKYYDSETKLINLDEMEALEAPLYVFLNAKEICQQLDLKKEVVLTMLNSLEKIEESKQFFKLESLLAASIGLRFHKTTPQELAKTNKFIRHYMELATEKQGVYRCSLSKLAYSLRMDPFQIPKILFTLQNNCNDGVSYELDQESFVLRIEKIPSSSHIIELSELMLQETRRVEKNMISKINCMYFIARKISLPNIDTLMKKEKTEDYNTLYKEYTKQVNALINSYFQIREEDDMEIQIAGSEEERNIMIPLQYISSFREKANVESQIKALLKDIHSSNTTSYIEPADRVKALDVVKILMGINSDKQKVKEYRDDSRVWAKLQDYDYEDIYKLATATVSQFYFENATGNTKSENAEDSKMYKKLKKDI